MRSGSLILRIIRWLTRRSTSVAGSATVHVALLTNLRVGNLLSLRCIVIFAACKVIVMNLEFEMAIKLAYRLLQIHCLTSKMVCGTDCPDLHAYIMALLRKGPWFKRIWRYSNLQKVLVRDDIARNPSNILLCVLWITSLYVISLTV